MPCTVSQRYLQTYRKTWDRSKPPDSILVHFASTPAGPGVSLMPDTASVQLSRDVISFFAVDALHMP